MFNDMVKTVVLTLSMTSAMVGLAGAHFPGYVKQGDSLTLTLDAQARVLGQLAVATWLEKPSDPVAFTVTMAALPDGTRYPGSTVLSIPGSHIEVRVTKSNYQKLAQ